MPVWKVTMAFVAFGLLIQASESKSANKRSLNDITDGIVNQNLEEISSNESVSWSEPSSEEDGDLQLLEPTTSTKHRKKATKQEQNNTELTGAPSAPASSAVPTTTTSNATVTTTTEATTPSKPTQAATSTVSAATESTSTTATTAPSAVATTDHQAPATSKPATIPTTTTSKPGHHGGAHLSHMSLTNLFKPKNNTVVVIRFVPLRELISEKFARLRNLFRKPATSTTKPEAANGSKHFHFKVLG